jgi:drug/metabolite transporter (DMT)-like permease
VWQFWAGIRARDDARLVHPPGDARIVHRVVRRGISKERRRAIEDGVAHTRYNWRLAAGVGAFLVSSVFFVMGVRHGELTVLYPMGSLGYIWTLVWSRIFFGEPFTRSKFVGLGMILLGIACLGFGSRV